DLGEAVPAQPLPRMLQSAELAQTLPAYCAAMGAMVNPRKDKEATGHGKTPDGRIYNYTYRYASAAAVNNMIREPLADNGLFVMSRLVPSDARANSYDLFVQ